MRVISLSNRKGGVSKTTTAVNMAGILAEKGYKVLLIDLDSQGDATENLGIDPNSLDKTIYDLFKSGHNGSISLKELVVSSEFGVDVIGANEELQNSEIELHNVIARDMILRNALKDTDLDYDFVILDLAPDMGLVSINGLIASTDVVIPIDLGFFSINAINDLSNSITLIREGELNEDIQLLGILITKVDNRTNLAKEVPKQLRENLEYPIFKTEIRQNVSITESQNLKMPINHYSKTTTGYIEYENFVNEVLEHVK